MNNFDMMRRRLEYQGGIHQEDRMIQDKYKTFLKTLKYSYQAAIVSMAQKHDTCFSAIVEAQPIEPIETAARALINPDRTKQDYDDKILSIDYKHDFEPGDIFCWRGTDTYWIIYLEELTEDAYFRGAIRRCKYKIKFKDEDGNWLETWAAIRGPVETDIDSIQKNQIRVDRPSLSLNILLPRNEKTLKAFDRYDEFLFAGRSWKVQAPDSISMRNIIEIAAKESYIDRDADDVDNEMKNGLIVEPVDPSPDTEIYGDTWIKPMVVEEYYIKDTGGEWKVPPGCPVELVVNEKDPSRVSVKWLPSTNGQFVLRWIKDDGSAPKDKTIVVESLF